MDKDSLYATRPAWRFSKDKKASFAMPSTGKAEGIAVDQTHVYWKDPTALVKCGKDGKGKITLTTWTGCSSDFYAYNVAVDDTHIYWLEQCKGEVKSIRKDGTEEKVLYKSSCVEAIAVDDKALYWLDCDRHNGAVMKMFK